MKLKKLLKGVQVMGPDKLLTDVDITSLVSNSKDVTGGSIFIAIKGYLCDGHDFIPDALSNGARAVIASRSFRHAAGSGNIIYVRDSRKALSTISANFYGSPSNKMKVFGVTGTNGKTTVSSLIESIFNTAGVPCGLIGTIDKRYGRRRIYSGRTTPDAITIHAFLNEMLHAGRKAVAMEISSHSLDQYRVKDVRLDVALFTNLTHEHLDYHKDLRHYFESKMKIFRLLKDRGVAVINADDKNAHRIIKAVRSRKITYSMTQQSDIWADVKSTSLDGSHFIVRLPNRKSFAVKTRLIGMHNISNILAAASVGISQGIDIKEIKNGIEKKIIVKGRLEEVGKPGGFRVFVDYAHTHDALGNVLRFLRPLAKGRIITVFGSGGDRDRTKRPLMGRVTQKLSDYVIITGDNPRSEDPVDIARDIEKGMNPKIKKHSIVPDRKRAIELALKKATRNDIVLVAGKGHETEQIVGNRAIPFDDRRVIEKALRVT